MEKVKVTICQREYSLKTDESPEKIKKLAAELEKTIIYIARKTRAQGEVDTVILASMILLSDIETIIREGMPNIDALQDELAAANEQLAAAKARVEELENGGNSEMETENALLHEENEKLEKLVTVLREEISSATSELSQLANVKEDENTKLRSKLAEYENDFEKMAEEREGEIRKLQDSFTSANSEMEQIAAEKEQENAKLRATLVNYEATFDMYVKKKEDEMRRVQSELEELKIRSAEMEKKLAQSGDIQMKIC